MKIWGRNREWWIKCGSRVYRRRYGLDPLHPLKLEYAYKDGLNVGKFEGKFRGP